MMPSDLFDPQLLGIQSGMPGLQWPPVAKASNAQLLALVQWLERSQWLGACALQAGQLLQLKILLTHFERQSPWVQKRMALHRCRADQLCRSLERFTQWPVTTRADVQRAGTAFHSRVVPAAHKPVAAKKTSGSTGQPVRVYRTAVNQLFWLATTLREHLWHRRDPKARLAVVRANLAQAFDRQNWGSPVGNLFDSGPSHGMPVTTDTQALLAWLLRIEPQYLLVYPSVWSAILDQLPPGKGLQGLIQVRTIGETLSDDLRSRTLRQLGVPMVDTYSSEEVGVIAIQCPHSGLYHTMAEGLIVEILTPDNQPCETGQVGRVVVTDLLNFASPMLRYDIGDYAEVGPACQCGRGLSTLKRVLGRERNMVKLPGGRSHWPLTGFHGFGSVANITQYQLVQKSLDLIEVCLVVDGQRLTLAHEQALSEIISRSMEHRFQYRFVYFAEHIPKPASGKFEEFVSDIQT